MEATEVGAHAQNDALYFASYAHLAIHEDMLRDRRRTLAYLQAVEAQRARIGGAVVLDVGAGVGVLSVFCARAGARKVYAVEASGVALHAVAVVRANRLADVVEVRQCRVEDLSLPEKVDVIISEWMGHFLVYENMFSSVIHARDKFLKEDGIMLPSHACMFLSACTQMETYLNRVAFWTHQYGIDFSPLIPHAVKSWFEQAQTETVPPQNLITFATPMHFINCYTASAGTYAEICSKFDLKAHGKARLTGFASWFDVFFGAGRDVNSLAELKASGALTLSTSPDCGDTHWRHTVFYLDVPIDVEQDDTISGSIVASRQRDNPRFFNATVAGSVDPAAVKFSKTFRVE